jgi:hypothetical protein
MKSRPQGTASQRAADTGIITQAGVVCDDCATEMHDWIESLNGALLCFACADFWEEVDVAVGA